MTSTHPGSGATGSPRPDPPADAAATIARVLRWRAEHEADRVAHVALADGEVEEERLTYAQLDARAQAIAAALRERTRPGDRALLLYPPGLGFVAAFWGCLYARVVAVPAYPPRSRSHMNRILAIVRDAGSTLALTTAKTLGGLRAGSDEGLLATLTWMATDTLPARPFDEVGGDPGDLAFLQYTSGSTGTPKGVMVTHANLAYDSRYIRHCFRLSPESVSVSWLPAFHDMGLVGGVIQPVFTGHPGVLLPPVSFIQKPVRWLQAITRYGGTYGGGPNFAYDLMVQKVTDEQLAGLDLRTMEKLYSGAEPVRPHTIRRFTERFAQVGFRPTSFYPCYGLAETTLMATGGQGLQVPPTATVDRAALEQGLVKELPADAAGVSDLAGSGQAVLETVVRIVDPETLVPAAPGRVGEIWVSGPSVCAGYWEREEATRETFGARLASGEGPFLRTGDLGFLRDDGELFVTGRRKDLIIVAGRNHYPQDVEWAAERAHPALRPASAAAFSVDVDGEERLVVAIEVERSAQRNADVEEIARAIARVVAEDHEVAVHAVALLKTATLPKTSSGKIQRRLCRQQWLDGQLSLVGSWTAPVVAAPAAARSSGIVAFLQERIGARTGRAPQAIAPDATFQSLGLDSIAAVAISGELSEHVGRALSPSILYDHPTLARLAAFLGDGRVDPRGGSGKGRPQGSSDIAIVGTGLRLPGGVRDRASLWALLQAGHDAVGEIPKDRFQTVVDPTGAKPGSTASRRGGFLDGIDRFDAEFFGISPKEAAGMDPQQRVLLEVAWEALEDAGIRPPRLAGTPAGVFMGISTHDYARLKLHSGALAGLDAYDGTGNAFSAAAGRLSYLLDLTGPSLAVDTACSSSLVAVHLACQSLLAGECDLALAGGVNLVLGPDLAVAFSRAGMMSTHGACRSFDEKADGFVRSEGCGVVVLRRLEDALAAGDHVLAVIRGTAVNQDGRSNGLTAPNGPSQERVIRQALEAARVAPDEVSYLEAHGSGTSLGDSIEAGALGAVFASRAQPLLVGSVKSNVGHLEAAAGVAGLLKAVTALEHEAVPPNVHFESPSSRIDWAALPLRVPTEVVAWPRGEKPRRAGVSSFGFTGTNAHVVLEEAPPASEPAGRERAAYVLPLSARTPPALDALRSEYARRLEREPLADVCVGAALRRTTFDHRLAIAGRSAAEIADQLARAVGQKADAPRLAFLFTGQGSQHAGMAQALLAQEPVFRDAFLACDEALRAFRDGSLAAVVAGEAPGLDDTTWTQPALFAFEYALAALWQSFGVVPDAVLGHSVGGYAAACRAGVFTLEDGLRLVEARGRLMGALPAGGGMLAVHAGEAAVGPRPEGVALAAVNAADEIVLSGRLDALRALASRLDAAGVRTTPLSVSHAFHSPLMDPARDAFAEVLAKVRLRAPSVEVISDLTGAAAGPEIATARYWLDHWSAPVRFADGLRTLQARGVLAVEVGPRPVLSALALKAGLRCLPSRRPRVDDAQQVAETLAALFAAGVNVSFEGFYAGVRHRRVALPAYPFQRERYWVPDVAPPSAAAGDPVLGRRVEAGVLRGTVAWQRDVVEPARTEPLAAHLAVTLAAAREQLGDGRVVVRDLEVFGAADGGTELGWHPLGDRAEVRVRDRDGLVRAAARVEKPGARRGPELGVMFFNGTEEAPRHRYRLVLESARFADRHGFSSVWVPERHYTAFGGLYPNPAVLQAALARETRGLRLMAGSVVASLHHPLRAAEDWALVDNLSDGRVGVSLASGWNPSDFAGAPGKYADRHEEVFRSLDLLRRLWRGESVDATSGTGEPIQVRVYPNPVQRELPVWITAASNPRTFERAGLVGAHVLTHLLDQDPEALAGKIAIYREARARAGHDPAAGRVTVMLHTFLGEDVETVREQVRKPYCAYIEANLGLLKGLAHSRGRDLDVDALSPQDRAAFVSFLYDRFFDTRALLGTPESVRPLVQSLQDAGVSEIACLLDFGPPTDEVLASLPHLARLNDALRALAVAETPAPIVVADVRARCADAIPAAAFARRLREQGKEPGDGLARAEVFHRRDGEALAAIAGDVADASVLDAALLAMAAALPEGAFTHAREGALVPAFAGACDVHRAGRAAWAHATLAARGDTFVGGVTLADADGAVLATLDGVELRRTAVAATTAAPDLDWTYEIEWREKPLPPAAASAPGRWLVLADGGGVGAALAARLDARGDAAVVVAPGQDDADALRETWRGVIHLRALDAAPNDSLDAAALARAEELGPGTLLRLVQAFAGRPVPIHVVTRSAQPVAGAVSEVAQAPVWGLGRVVALEHPECWGGLVDLPSGAPDVLAALVVAELGASDREDQAAWRAGRRYVPRLQPCAVPAGTPPAFDAEATYLVTGGLGGLGRRIAAWMVRHGARDLVLTGVRALPATSDDPAVRERLAAVKSLEAQGARVTVLQADAADHGSMERVFAAIAEHGRPLKGVVHLAGLPENRAIADTVFGRDRGVMAPKVTGAWVLHDLVGDTPVDFFVTFSSISAVWGSRGQPLYAAANHFLDALASHRRAAGRPSLNVSWGPWSEGGMVDPEGLALLGRMGVQPLDPSDATRALGRLMARGDAPAVVANVDWPTFKELFEARGRRPLLEDLGRRADAADGAASELLREIEAMAAPERHAALLGRVLAEVGAVLGWPAPRVPEPRRGFFEMGMDSLMALDLKNRLQGLLGKPLRATVVFNHPSADALTAFLLQEMAPAAPAPVDAAPAATLDTASEADLLSAFDAQLAAIEAGLSEPRD